MKIENVAVISLEDYKLSTRMVNIVNKKMENLDQPEEYKIIPLTKGKFAKVDNEDFEILSKFNWKCNYHNYARSANLGLIHRFIMKCPEGKMIDHINHDTLDNRKCNLRICTNSQNMMNRKSVLKFKSKYKGVAWIKRTSLWRSSIKKDGVNYFLGYFKDEIEAAKEYDKKAIELFGEYALTNF